MTLFDDIERTDTGPARYAEPHCPYLNRSARLDAGRVRVELEGWFARYPTEHQIQLRARFRSSQDDNFLGAFFELYVHELLTRLGHQVRVHPALDTGRAQKPDFLVRTPRGDAFYMEATVATDRSRDDAAGEARVNQAYDALNRLDSPNFFLYLQVNGSPETPIPARRLRAAVQAFLKKLDPDECSRMLENDGLRSLPSETFSHDGWTVEYSAIPKSPKARGGPGLRPIGITAPRDVYRIDPIGLLRGAVRKKATRYGRLEYPFIVAVDSVAQQLGRGYIMEALFGTEQLVQRQGDPRRRTVRAQDGVWAGPRGPVNRRVSAVLVASLLNPWSVVTSVPAVYHNPWAIRPCPEALSSLATAVPIGDNMEFRDGATPVEVFGLPTNWPGDDEELNK